MTTKIIESCEIIGAFVAAAAITAVCGLGLMVWFANRDPRPRPK